MKTCIQVVFIASIKTPIPSDFLAQVRAEVEAQPGFLGRTSNEEDGVETTMSYWQDEASLQQWATNKMHLAAKQRFKEFYHSVEVKIIKDQPLPNFD